MKDRKKMIILEKSWFLWTWMSWNWIDSKQCTCRKWRDVRQGWFLWFFMNFLWSSSRIGGWRIEKWEGIKSIISYLLNTINVIKDALTTRYWAFFMLYINEHTWVSEKEGTSAKWWKYIQYVNKYDCAR